MRPLIGLLLLLLTATPALAFDDPKAARDYLMLLKANPEIRPHYDALARSAAPACRSRPLR